MLPLAPKLNRANVNDKLMRHLCNLQDDPEPSIRTNTVICMSRIASFTTVETRRKLLVGAFTKATRQGFPHTRVAGIRAIINTYGDLMDKPQDLVSKVLPTLCLLFNDPSSDVRALAFTAAKKIISDLEDRSKELEKKEKEQAAAATDGTSGASNAGGGATKQEAAASGGLSTAAVSSNYLSQAAGWAMSGLSKQWSSKADGGTISPEKPPTAESAPQQPPQPVVTQATMPTETAPKAVVVENGWNDEEELDSGDDIFHDTLDKPKQASLSSPMKGRKSEEGAQGVSKKEGSREERKLRLQKRREEARAKRKSKQKLSATKLAKEALKDDDFFNSF